MPQKIPLDDEEMAALVKVLVSVGELGHCDAQTRAAFLSRLGLGVFADRINLNAPPQAFATNLVFRLANFGTLPDDLRFHALGKLLVGIRQELDTEHRIAVQALIQKYALINDEEYRSQLEFELSQATLSEPHLNRATRSAPPFQWKGPESVDALERLIGPSNFLPVSFLTEGAVCSRAVCKIQYAVANEHWQDVGTGFLVADDTLLTNHHVIPDLADAVRMRLLFDYERRPDGTLKFPGTSYRLRARENSPFATSPEEGLDFTLINVEFEGSEPPGAMFGHLGARLTEKPPNAGDRVYIIQHPGGRPKELVIDSNQVCAVDILNHRVQYLANTEPGSSGSPVFNNRWEVVALHHSGAPLGPISDWLAKKCFHGNEGILTGAILSEIRTFI